MATALFDVFNLELTRGQRVHIEPVPGAPTFGRFEIAPLVAMTPGNSEKETTLERASRVTGLAMATVEVAEGELSAEALRKVYDELLEALIPVSVLLSFAQRRAVYLSGLRLLAGTTAYGVAETRAPNLLGRPWNHPLIHPSHTEQFLEHAWHHIEELDPKHKASVDLAIRLHQIALRADTTMEIRFIQHYVALDHAVHIMGLSGKNQKDILTNGAMRLRQAGWPDEKLPKDDEIDKIVEMRHDIVHQADRARKNELKYIHLESLPDHEKAWLHEAEGDMQRFFELCTFELLGFEPGEGLMVDLSDWNKKFVSWDKLITPR